MRTLLMICLLALPLLAEVPQVEFRQHLGATVPDVRLVDETGREATLHQLEGGRPTLLVLGYYHCPMLCHQVQGGLVDSLRQLDWSAGQQFTVLTVSIDPRERPPLALAKQTGYLSRYDRPGAAAGWRFLTGSPRQLQALQQAVGFESAYDAESDQYAHPAGIVVLTPEGRVSSYLLGIDFPARALKLALQRAAAGRLGDPADRLLLLCYHYDPATGKYGFAIMRTLQLACLITLLFLGRFLLRGRK